MFKKTNKHKKESPPPKRGKVKNPCKICFKTVGNKNGLQCQGACKKWVHFKCLSYTPGKIQDIKKGFIQAKCPCPNCETNNNKKEKQLKGAPFFCGKSRCPASSKPVCESPACPKKKPIADAAKHSCPEDCDSTVNQYQDSNSYFEKTSPYLPKKNSPSQSSSQECLPVQNNSKTCERYALHSRAKSVQHSTSILDDKLEHRRSPERMRSSEHKRTGIREKTYEAKHTPVWKRSLETKRTEVRKKPPEPKHRYEREGPGPRSGTIPATIPALVQEKSSEGLYEQERSAKQRGPPVPDKIPKHHMRHHATNKSLEHKYLQDHGRSPQEGRIPVQEKWSDYFHSLLHDISSELGHPSLMQESQQSQVQGESASKVMAERCHPSRLDIRLTPGKRSLIELSHALFKDRTIKSAKYPGSMKEETNLPLENRSPNQEILRNNETVSVTTSPSSGTELQNFKASPDTQFLQRSKKDQRAASVEKKAFKKQRKSNSPSLISPISNHEATLKTKKKHRHRKSSNKDDQLTAMEKPITALISSPLSSANCVGVNSLEMRKDERRKRKDEIIDNEKYHGHQTTSLIRRILNSKYIQFPSVHKRAPYVPGSEFSQNVPSHNDSGRRILHRNSSSRAKLVKSTPSMQSYQSRERSSDLKAIKLCKSDSCLIRSYSDTHYTLNDVMERMYTTIDRFCGFMGKVWNVFKS